MRPVPALSAPLPALCAPILSDPPATPARFVHQTLRVLRWHIPNPLDKGPERNPGRFTSERAPVETNDVEWRPTR